MKNNSKEIVLDFKLPGFKREDIHINIGKRSVVIKAKKKERNRVQKRDFFHEERASRAFNYTTTLPEVNPEKARIDFNKGRLHIEIPKAMTKKSK